MSSRIRIYDHFCKPLVELSGIPTTPRGWLLNKFSRCEFSVGFNHLLPQSVQRFQERYFQFGNLIQIEHFPSTDWTLAKRGKLPDWTGIILPDRSWDAGKGHVTAYSAEAILAFRAMPYVTVSNTPAGMFSEILRLAQLTANNIIFQPGVLDDIAITLPADLRVGAYDEILTLITDAKMDWDVTGQIDDKGNLQLFANLYQQKGTTTGFTLTSSNTELTGALLTEQGTPSNVVFGYSEASTKESRFGPLTGTNQEAVNDYGPLQLNQVYQGKHDPRSVQRNAQNKADVSGRPRKMFGRVALDKGLTFNHIAVGNILTVKDNRVGFHPNGGYGFEAQVRILRMDYNDMSNKVVLNIEVI